MVTVSSSLQKICVENCSETIYHRSFNNPGANEHGEKERMDYMNFENQKQSKSQKNWNACRGLSIRSNVQRYRRLNNVFIRYMIKDNTN
mmetsp:Transcript_9386/g.22812  ORF Transcript_9386/g.22812 Transcript_9386/m.22812 type:complete len:89 (-) Transcript_9386:343-609(-)